MMMAKSDLYFELGKKKLDQPWSLTVWQKEKGQRPIVVWSELFSDYETQDYTCKPAHHVPACVKAIRKQSRTKTSTYWTIRIKQPMNKIARINILTRGSQAWGRQSKWYTCTTLTTVGKVLGSSSSSLALVPSFLASAVERHRQPLAKRKHEEQVEVVLLHQQLRSDQLHLGLGR